MIDTINDVVIGDIGDEIVDTSGVAVRPFWWSTECVQALGFVSGEAAGEAGSDSTAGGQTSEGTSVTNGTGSETTVDTGGQTVTTGAGTAPTGA
ncbi:MAG: hypothetical protein LLG45_00165, partial [Actinomycetia bacterium]|nr:hypothetical protein [Actinomycetes bacterium]